MNERERRANEGLRALDHAYRSGRITREEYRARRRTMLGSLCDSDGVTARNVLAPAALKPPSSGNAGAQRGAATSGDMASALFPDHRRMTWKLWLMAVGGLGLVVLLLYALLQAGAG